MLFLVSKSRQKTHKYEQKKIDYEERRLDELSCEVIMQYSPLSIFWRFEGDECSLPVDFDESVSKSFPCGEKKWEQIEWKILKRRFSSLTISTVGRVYRSSRDVRSMTTIESKLELLATV
jgi:hypothetical protein